MKRTRVGLQVMQSVNDALERLPDRYKVFVIEEPEDDTPPELKETLECASFQEALQAFINRL